MTKIGERLCVRNDSQVHFDSWYSSFRTSLLHAFVWPETDSRATIIYIRSIIGMILLQRKGLITSYLYHTYNTLMLPMVTIENHSNYCG